MKKILFISLMILTLAVGTAGCGDHDEETLSAAEAVDTTEAITVEETEILPQTEETTETASETTESSEEETTKAAISEEKAKELLLEEFGAVDEGSGDKNVFTYEKIITVDGVEYYSYKWEAGDGTYLCNAFVKTDGTDVMTGIYADGKWELGSDFGDEDSDFDEGSGDMGDDEEYYDEEYYDSDDVPYDDGFGDIDDEEEPAEDDPEE